MKIENQTRLELSPEILDAVKSFPIRRTFQHCGATFSTSPFDIYADCPPCGATIKVRSFSGALEIEDVFDAVFEWMSLPGARELAAGRMKVIEADKDE